MKRLGKYACRFPSSPVILSGAGSVGKTEGEGPLAYEFDFINKNDGVGSATWEKAEASLVRQAVTLALDKAKKQASDVDVAFAGDLLNQCTASTFGFREMNIPMAGLFGACSTFALALFMAALFVDGGYADTALCEASSHFCSAEKQFRMPLEYGGQRSQTAQRTVTGAGACVVGREGAGPRIVGGSIGRITDLDVFDPANMGAAMAPAAAAAIGDYLLDTATAPEDYDLILTGDLGLVGRDLLFQVIREDYGCDLTSVHDDCGLLVFDREKQDVHAGGSGCGCSASVFSTAILRKLSRGELGRVLFAGTGALMSPLSSLQGESIPCICHVVEITGGDKK